MKLLLVVVALAACAIVAEGFVLSKHVNLHGHRRREEREALRTGIAPVKDLPPALFYTQTLDHFDNQNTATYQQRYYVNSTFFNPNGGPVFLYIEGEGAASPYDVLYGHHMDMAKTHQALVFAVEHRYYGASVPTPDLSTPNLRWLSSQQALSDLATFHAFAVATWNLTASNTWICFGGSYPGALSAWFRLKFPHLVYGAVASSAPVRAQTNFEMYNEVVGNSLSMEIVGGSSSCLSAVEFAFSTMNMLLGTSVGIEKLQGMFSTCEPLANATANDTMTFIGNVAGVFQGVVQYNNEEPGLNIAQICQYFANYSDPLTALAQVVNASQSGACMDISYANSLAQLANITVDRTASGVGDRQWTYQTCTQFGYYQTCDANTTCPFLSPVLDLKSNTDLCWDLFGIASDSIDQHVDFSNDYYGADQPDGNRILFVNGNVDPWHALSVLSNIPGSDQDAILIDGTAHCANMNSAQPNDLPSLTAARRLIELKVQEWLEEANN